MNLTQSEVVVQGNWRTTSLKRAAVAVAAILVREGIGNAQSKAVFKAARQRAGLRAAPERCSSVDQLSIEERVALPRPACARDGRTGLMLQTVLETGARSSELAQFRVGEVSLAERVITVRQGKSLHLRRRRVAGAVPQLCQPPASLPRHKPPSAQPPSIASAAIAAVAPTLHTRPPTRSPITHRQAATIAAIGLKSVGQFK